MEEPRTNVEILRDIIEYLGEQEWLGQYERCPRGCCRDWVYKCSECDTHQSEGKHKEGCRFERMLREGRAYLAAEEELEEARLKAENSGAS